MLTGKQQLADFLSFGTLHLIEEDKKTMKTTRTLVLKQLNKSKEPGIEQYRLGVEPTPFTHFHPSFFWNELH
jgi:hypothetical protein